MQTVSPSRTVSSSSVAAAAPTCCRMVSGFDEAVGTMRTVSRPVASRNRASRSKRPWYWLRIEISTMPSSRPCLIRRLTLACDRLVSRAISAWVMPS